MGIAVEVLPIGPVAVASRLWRHRGRRMFTAVVKATFALQQDGPMTILPPLPIVTEERHYRNNPVASLVRGSDLALLVPKPEVVIVGAAYAGTGRTTTHTTVRLAVQRASTIVINKRLEIIGDRRAKPGSPVPDPQPFHKMPILYERARGGIAARDNPVGIGMATDPDGMLTLPNINLPAQAAAPQGTSVPAGLGPIPSAWPLRQKKRGSLSWTAANLSGDVDVPDDFDDAYYQTAPADQQAPELRAGDLVAIVNMHPDLVMLRTTLPRERAVAMAQTSRGDRIPMSLRIDTVHIEPDAMRAEIVFRGAAVIDERDLADLRLAGALEQPGSPLEFPDLSTVSGLVTRRTDAALQAPNFETTALIDEPVSPALRQAAERALRDSAPPAPMKSPGFERLGRAGTMVMEPERQPEERRRSTMLIEPEEDAAPPPSMPFDRNRGPHGTSHRPGTLPSKDATPWAVVPPPATRVAPPMDEETADVREVFGLDMDSITEARSIFDESTLDVDSDTKTPKRAPERLPPAAPVIAAPAVVAPVAVAPAVVAPVAAAPAVVAPVAAAPAVAAPALAPPQRANLKQDLYKKLKR